MFVALALAAIPVLLASSALAKDDRPPLPSLDPSTILVRFAKGSTPAAAIAAAGERAGGKTANGVHIVRLSSGHNAAGQLARYRRMANVVYAEPNYLRSADLSPPNDPSFSAQWGLSAIRVVGGWSVNPGAYGASGTK